MSSSKSNNANANASASGSKAATGKGGAPKALPNGVVLPLQPKGTTKAQTAEWPRASSSKTKADTQSPLVFGSANALAGPVRSMQLNVQASSYEPSQPQNPYMKNLLRDSEPDKSTQVVEYTGPVIVHGDGAGKGKGKAPAAKETSPIGTRPPGAFAINSVFTTDVAQAFQGGHFLRIHNITDVAEWHLGVQHYHHDFDGEFVSRLYDIKISEPSDLRRHVSVYLVVDDFRQAPFIIDSMPVVMQHWQIEHVSFSAYVAAPGNICKTTKPPLHYDGQVLFVAQPKENKPFTKEIVADLEKSIYDVASIYGTVHALTPLGGDESQWQFRVEFHAITSAHYLLNRVNVMDPHPVFGGLAVAYPYTERPTQDTDDEDDTTEASSATPHQRKSKVGGSEGITTSPTGRTAWSTGADGKYIMQKPPHVAPKVRTNRAPPQPMPPQPMHPMQAMPMQHMAMQPMTMQPMTMPLWNAANPLGQDHRFYQESHPMPGQGGMMHGHNQGQGGQVVVYDREVRDSRSQGWGTGPLGRVHGRRDNRNMDPNEPQSINLERLALGHDVRTTIMLRNIPNQWNYRDLKARLDQICAGKYDFTYLRIDFEKATNVGYGFINLTHPDHVVPFVKAIVNAEWAPGMYPRKLGQISYATIQGIDCLTEKFRNSAIMSEFPDYRPKLWYTAADAPDMGMIGTEKPFPAPNNFTKTQRSHDNAGTIGLFAPRSQQRTADRSRRSNYDRGTQHQLEEEAAYAGPAYGYNNYTAAAAHAAPPPAPYYTPAGYGMPYYPPPPFYGYPAYGHPGFPVPHPQQWVDPYSTSVPASRLRTISQGRLAGRPQNVSVAASHIPRSFQTIPEEPAAATGAADSAAAAEEAEMAN